MNQITQSDMPASGTPDALVESCVEAIYQALLDLDKRGMEWVHSPRVFLPANVVCDTQGIANFKLLLRTTLERELQAAQSENARLRAALTDLEQALLMDSHDKTILADTVEYHLDGQAMYHALNKARAALAKVSDSA